VRHLAISQLQRFLLANFVVLNEPDHNQIEEIFNRVVFPLLDELLKPQIFMRDPMGMPETRLRASALLCKTFMHFEVRDTSSQADIRLLWIQILDLMDRLMNVDRKDQLVRSPSGVPQRNAHRMSQYEAIPESLKNVVLVMNATQILVPPSSPDERTDRQKTMWTATQERMERFLPGFLADVIPPVAQQGPPPPIASTAA
jgi:golgi-specific brefeldin A-resistance guanine nucleotide exchange factor 1